jgi:hypothetical protein
MDSSNCSWRDPEILGREAHAAPPPLLGVDPPCPPPTPPKTKTCQVSRRSVVVRAETEFDSEKIIKDLSEKVRLNPSCRPRSRACGHARMRAPCPPPPHAPLPSLNPQWDKVENKTGVVIYGAGAVVALWLSSTVIGAINAVPLVRPRPHAGCMRLHAAVARMQTHACKGFRLAASLAHTINLIAPHPPRRLPQLPKLMELVGLGYTAWFVYRYLLFKDSREELVK